MNCTLIIWSWNLRMMYEKWLFSNHVDTKVVTTLFLQSVVLILSAVCALICYEIVQHSDYVTSWQNGKAPRGYCCMLQAYVTRHQILTWTSWMQTEHGQKASSALNVLSFTRFLCNSVGAKLGQTPGSGRRKSTQRFKKKQTKTPPAIKSPTTSRSRGLWLPNKISDWRVVLHRWTFKSWDGHKS